MFWRQYSCGCPNAADASAAHCWSAARSPLEATSQRPATVRAPRDAPPALRRSCHACSPPSTASTCAPTVRAHASANQRVSSAGPRTPGNGRCCSKSSAASASAPSRDIRETARLNGGVQSAAPTTCWRSPVITQKRASELPPKRTMSPGTPSKMQCTASSRTRNALAAARNAAGSAKVSICTSEGYSVPTMSQRDQPGLEIMVRRPALIPERALLAYPFSRPCGRRGARKQSR